MEFSNRVNKKNNSLASHHLTSTMKFTSEIIFNFISQSLSVELKVIYFSILPREINKFNKV
jgi:hypothetical protein